MKRRTPQLHYAKRSALGAILVLLAACFYLLSAQVIAWRPVGAHVPANQPAKLLPCAAPDAKYCSLVRRLVPAVEAGDFSQLIADQEATLVRCPNLAAEVYCTAAHATLPIELFTVYQHDQPKLMMRNDYVAFFRSYEARTGVFAYVDQQAGTQNPLLFHGLHGTVSLELQLQKLPDGTWQLAWPITTE